MEIRSWRDRNLKFGPNCDLEVDDSEKKLKIWQGEAEPLELIKYLPTMSFDEINFLS